MSYRPEQMGQFDPHGPLVKHTERRNKLRDFEPDQLQTLLRALLLRTIRATTSTSGADCCVESRGPAFRAERVAG